MNTAIDLTHLDLGQRDKAVLMAVHDLKTQDLPAIDTHIEKNGILKDPLSTEYSLKFLRRMGLLDETGVSESGVQTFLKETRPNSGIFSLTDVLNGDAKPITIEDAERELSKSPEGFEKSRYVIFPAGRQDGEQARRYGYTVAHSGSIKNTNLKGKVVVLVGFPEGAVSNVTAGLPGVLVRSLHPEFELTYLGERLVTDIELQWAIQFAPEYRAPEAWECLFKLPKDMNRGDVDFLIKDFLSAGITFIGGLPSAGKSWFALSMSRALTTGTRFLGFDVPEPVNVLYLTPEVGEKSLTLRIDRLGIPSGGRFRATTNDIALTDPRLLEACARLKPVVFIDTLIRFGQGDENSASDVSKLFKEFKALLGEGARAVVVLHHSRKPGNGSAVNLETALRGSGDLGAQADCTYALRCIDSDKLTVQVTCVKNPRDFDRPKDFTIQGRPYINETGNFGVLTEPGESLEETKVKKLIAAIQANPKASNRELQAITGIDRNRIPTLADKEGWSKQGDLWDRKPV